MNAVSRIARHVPIASPSPAQETNEHARLDEDGRYPVRRDHRPGDVREPADVAATRRGRRSHRGRDGRPSRALRCRGAASAAALDGPIADSELSIDDEPTSFETATTYNNFYELGTDKKDPSKNADVAAAPTPGA